MSACIARFDHNSVHAGSCLPARPSVTALSLTTSSHHLSKGIQSKRAAYLLGRSVRVQNQDFQSCTHRPPCNAHSAVKLRLASFGVSTDTSPGFCYRASRIIMAWRSASLLETRAH